MTDKPLNDIIKQKNEQIQKLKNQKNILFKQLYKAKHELTNLKRRIKQHTDTPEQILLPDNDEQR